MKQFLTRRWFLIALGLVLLVGTALGPRAEFLIEQASIRHGVVAVVLFLMALPVEASAMWQALRRPWVPLLATLLNFGLLPLFAWGVSAGLERGLAAGLLIAATTPCTLASASVWTRRAGGNDSAAIMVTIVTNATCFLITPAWLMLMIGRSSPLPVGDLIQKLGLLVVLPMVLAQLLRIRRPLAWWATRQKIPLGVVAQCGILSMIFMGAIRTGITVRSQQTSATLADYALMVVAVLGVHTVMLFAGMMIAGLVRFKREDRIAVGIAGSQKTLMVGLQNGLELGITVIPMVVYHVGQLLIDTVIADRLRKHGENQPNQSSESENANG